MPGGNDADREDLPWTRQSQMMNPELMVDHNTGDASDLDDGDITNNNEKSGSEPTHIQGGCNAVTVISLSYAIAATVFVIGFNITQMYDLPFPLIGNLLPRTLWNYYETTVVAILVMWGIHFIRRFTEVLFVHVYSRRQSVLEAVGGCIYYGFFGLWVGWACNYHLGYKLPHPGFFYPGVILFTIGEVGNCAHHVKLRLLHNEAMQLRNEAGTQAAVARRPPPTGLMFEYASSPHYFFEILSWLGFSLATMVLPAFVFLLAGAITMVVYSRKRHNQYQRDCPGYDKKMLIPFVI